MKCPTCAVPLTMSERQGIEIDYCPQCRGVWLDRGELDKIIERAGGGGGGMAAPRPEPTEGRFRVEQYQGERHREQQHYGHRKKKENWLEDLFD